MFADDSRNILGLDSSLEISLRAILFYTSCSQIECYGCSPVACLLLELISGYFRKTTAVCFGMHIEVCWVLCPLKAVFYSDWCFILHSAASKPDLLCTSAVTAFSFEKPGWEWNTIILLSVYAPFPPLPSPLYVLWENWWARDFWGKRIKSPETAELWGWSPVSYPFLLYLPIFSKRVCTLPYSTKSSDWNWRW